MKDNIYACVNSINKGDYAYNNLSAYYLTWYHKINEKWHTDFESWYQYQSKTPNIFNPNAASLILPNANGAWCKTATQLTCYAPEWTVLNYLYTGNAESPRFSPVFRARVFRRSARPSAPAIKSRYYPKPASPGNHWIGSTIVFRPELRWEHAFDNPAFDGGTHMSQFMFAGRRYLVLLIS